MRKVHGVVPNIDYLDGCIYHMVHFENLPGIFQRRALLSREKILQENISYRSIAYEEIQNLRDRIFVWDPLSGNQPANGPQPGQDARLLARGAGEP